MSLGDRSGASDQTEVNWVSLGDLLYDGSELLPIGHYAKRVSKWGSTGQTAVLQNFYTLQRYDIHIKVSI